MEQYRIIEEYIGDVTTPTAYQHVEAALKVLCGPEVAVTLHPDSLLPILQRCATHPNRFVREGLFEVVQALLVSGPTLLDIAERKKRWDCEAVALLLRRGMADNWSQVRYAASRAVRTFLTETTLPDPQRWHTTLLPPLCLNRHYIADGVRNYNMETWKLVVGIHGRDLIAQHIAHFVEYYADQAEADNHAVREAACQCVCEVAMRIEKSAVRPHVPALLDTLLNSFEDESWPVRDHACLSSSMFVKEFAEECRGSLDVLYPLWLHQCGDPIPSVRVHAAQALGAVLAAYRQEAREFLSPLLEDMLKAVEGQKAEGGAAGYANVTTFAVAKRLHDNDEASHVDQTMYSCGSLAPRMNKGNVKKKKDKHEQRPKHCGCSGGGAGLKRTDDPWFLTDCGVHLLKEWAHVYPEDSLQWFSRLPVIVSCTQFIHHTKLWCTVYGCLPDLVTTLLHAFRTDDISKTTVEDTLKELVPHIFKAAESPNDLAAFAAGQCVVDLCKIDSRLLRFSDDILTAGYREIMATKKKVFSAQER